MRRFILLICAILCLCSQAYAEIYAVNFSGGAVAIDETGAAVIPAGTYDRLYTLRNDDGKLTGYAAGIISGNTYLYAVLNSEGTPLSDHVYSTVSSAGEGCIVSRDGKYSYHSSAHKYDDLTFSAMTYAGSGMILAVNGNIYDDIGDTISILWADGISFRTGISILNGFGTISEGLMPLYDDDTRLFGYINNQGSWVIKPAYKYAAPFKNGLAIIATEDGYGVIDSKGSILLAPNSRQLARSGDIFAMIRGDALRVYDVDLKITAVMPLNGAEVNLTGEYIIISAADSEAVYDAYGNLLFTAPAWSHITDAGNGVFIVRSGSWSDASVTLLWLDGSPLSPACHSIYTLDSANLAYAIADSDGILRYGIMAADGTFVTDAIYNSIACVTEGMYCADTDTGAVILDSHGMIMNTFKSSSKTPQS